MAREGARELNDPPPDYNPRWGGGSRTERFTSSVGQWLGVVDRNEGGWDQVGTMPRSSRSGYYELTGNPSDSEGEVTERQSRARRTLRYVRGKLSRQQQREEAMSTLPTFRPWFTVLISVVTIGLFIAVCITDGIAPISFTPKQHYGLVEDFNGQQVPVTREDTANFFIGPSGSDLIHHGAKFSPCMRSDSRLDLAIQQCKNEEILYKCCQSTNDYCGMMPSDRCSNDSIVGGLTACENPPSGRCQNGISIRPCCLGSTGQCVLTTRQNCSFYDGVWHGDKLLCHHTILDCLRGVCELTWSSSTFSGSNPNQWYRLIIAVFMYNGVIQLVILLAIQLYFCYKIERRIGWLRIFLIYMISGVGGYLTSCIFDPDTVGTGPCGALYGLLGVQLVELVQSWKYINHPFLELIKLLINVIVLLVIGLLPYIDNFANIGGFVFGVLSSFIFVPYISIGKWDRITKLCLISIALPTIVILYLFGFIVFFNIQDGDFCSWCHYLNCIPITDNFCDGFDLSSFYQQSPS
ncbi:inactive rhomboid protein 1-like [Dysidea avara]|uniref:inactive rhomboid protein 1-like n=1 Tax=Dysidea avara TaxID=196820 RepID=UPI0033211A50